MKGVKEDTKMERKESKQISEGKKESEDNTADDDKVSEISMSDVSELSQHSCLELDKEMIEQY